MNLNMTILSEMRVKIIAVCVMIVTAASLWVSPACSTESETLHTVLTETILSLDKARNTVLEKHFRASGNVDPEYSREDALLFAAYLDGRINHYCTTLYLSGGEQSLDNLPCGNSGESVPGGPRFDSVPDFSGQTSEEKVASLDQELTTTLGEFDDMLLKEQERAAAHIPRQRESGGAGHYGQATGGEQSGTESGGRAGVQEQPPGSRTAESDSGDEAKGEMEQGKPTEGAGGGEADSSRLPPAEGSKELSEDDDVVARQLREAAEQETDPEVKEKLWEEYRKYKEGIK
ncbi:MAG: hypothetical protein ACR2PB_10060 [Desulfocapsaceae bacterium]